MIILYTHVTANIFVLKQNQEIWSRLLDYNLKIDQSLFSSHTKYLIWKRSFFDGDAFFLGSKIRTRLEIYL